MRIRRVSRSGTSPGKSATKESNATLRVLEQPDQASVTAGGTSEDRPFGSLESMFEEISFGDFINDQAQRRPRFMGKYDDLWQLSLADPLTGPGQPDVAARSADSGADAPSAPWRVRHRLAHRSEQSQGHQRPVRVHLGQRGAPRCDPSPDVDAPQRGHGQSGGGERAGRRHDDREREVRRPLMQRVREVLDNPIAVAGGAVRVSTTLGTVTARNSESAEEVLARAGHAA
jgi:hypothetical protein